MGSLWITDHTAQDYLFLISQLPETLQPTLENVKVCVGGGMLLQVPLRP